MNDVVRSIATEAGIDPSVGSVGDSYDNALAESIIGLFKTEVINFFDHWKTVGQVEWETLNWVNWYNVERLHSAIGHRPPLEVEEAFYANLNALDKVTWVLNKTLSGKPGAVQHFRIAGLNLLAAIIVYWNTEHHSDGHISCSQANTDGAKC